MKPGAVEHSRGAGRGEPLAAVAVGRAGDRANAACPYGATDGAGLVSEAGITASARALALAARAGADPFAIGGRSTELTLAGTGFLDRAGRGPRG